MSPGDRSKFAESIAKGYGKKDGGEEKSDPAESDDDAARAAAGDELKSALESGDGAEIYRAFEALNELCKGG